MGATSAISSVGNAISNAARSTGNAARAVGRNPYVRTGAALFANPLIAQDVSLSRLVGGGDAKDAAKAPGQAGTNPEDYARKHQRELAATNAALAGGAAGGALGVGMAIPSAGFVAPGGVILSGAAGAAAGAGAGALAGGYASDLATPDPAAPPETFLAGPVPIADPQQKRRRQNVGRAGTILTGGTGSGGTTLGGAGGRSTLLGL